MSRKLLTPNEQSLIERKMKEAYNQKGWNHLFKPKYQKFNIDSNDYSDLSYGKLFMMQNHQGIKYGSLIFGTVFYLTTASFPEFYKSVLKHLGQTGAMFYNKSHEKEVVNFLNQINENNILDGLISKILDPEDKSK